MVEDLDTIARSLVGPGVGILAADESTKTITKRFEALGISSAAETRLAYRELLVTTPSLDEYISGVILYDETIRQTTSDGTPFPGLLDRCGLLTGIKVDTGVTALAGAPGEQVTEGLDGLERRIAEYRELGARFAKWRAVIRIGDGVPTRQGLATNARALARYARLCQEGGLVPIVEPEVLMDGDHTIDRCEEVTEDVLTAVFASLREHGVVLEEIVLKPNMVLPGADCATPATARDVASATLRCLRRAVPAAVPGVAFLSGGQGPQRATEHLNLVNTAGPQPWELSFSFGRALQDPALKAWKGESVNVEAGQDALRHRARCNSAARIGSYGPEHEAG